jgi:hypothetical protein
MAVLRRAGVVLIVAALALGIGGAMAGAKKKHKKKGHAWSSKITLQHPASTQFTGKVDSKFSACFKGRLVNVFFTDTSSGQTALLSVQRTDGKGRYRVDLTQAAYPGVYQAQAPKERIRAKKAPQTCKQSVSRVFSV